LIERLSADRPEAYHELVVFEDCREYVHSLPFVTVSMCLVMEKLWDNVTPKAVICYTLSIPLTASGGTSMW